jgi:hypothetical protein
MDAPIRIEANGEPRVLRPVTRPITAPLCVEDALSYARACLPADTPETLHLSFATLVRHVLADIRDLP